VVVLVRENSLSMYLGTTSGLETGDVKFAQFASEKSLERSGLLYPIRVPKRNKTDSRIVAVLRTLSTTRI